MNSDVVIAGGSVAGLLCAREIASRGFSVIVIEKDYEIGTPEHCGGLVSLTGLQELGIVPFRDTFKHFIESASIHSPKGVSLVIDVDKKKITQVNRRELDKQIAHQAQKNGARIKVRTSFQEITDKGIRTSDGHIDCKIFVDARGVASLIHKDRTGILPSAQYEIYADWIKKGKVEVMFDQKQYPEFFAWIIPSDEGKGKVGVAGKNINAAQVIDNVLKDRKDFSIIRKIFAPIWIKGPIKEFVKGNTVIVGDAAGQAKPTTAGGIYTSGMGGVYAGQAIAKFLETGDKDELKNYQKRWTKKFGREFERQKLARKLLGRLDNTAIDKLFELVPPQVLKEISDGDDFDFHTSAIIRLLGVKGSIKTAQALMSSKF